MAPLRRRSARVSGNRDVQIRHGCCLRPETPSLPHLLGHGDFLGRGHGQVERREDAASTRHAVLLPRGETRQVAAGGSEPRE